MLTMFLSIPQLPKIYTLIAKQVDIHEYNFVHFINSIGVGIGVHKNPKNLIKGLQFIYLIFVLRFSQKTIELHMD